MQSLCPTCLKPLPCECCPHAEGVSDMHHFSAETHDVLERVTASTSTPTAITERRRFALARLGAVELRPTDTGVMHGPRADRVLDPIGRWVRVVGERTNPYYAAERDALLLVERPFEPSKLNRCGSAEWWPMRGVAHRVPGTTRTV